MIEFFKQLRWQDLVDVILMTIIIYRLLLLVKGNKGAHMSSTRRSGPGSFLSFRYFELYTMDWLIQSFWARSSLPS